jgi:glycosyltransferase involved in cell wall biosynthesis
MIIMKALFFLGAPNPFPGAGWTRISFFAHYWAQRKNNVMVLGTFSIKTMNMTGAKNEGTIRIRNLIFDLGLNHPLAIFLNFFLSFIISTLFLLAWRPRTIVVTLPRGDVGLGCIAAAVLLRKKVVIDYCDEWEDYAISSENSKIAKLFNEFVKRLATCFYRRAWTVACVTSNMRRSIVERGVKNVVLIPNGVDITTFKPKERSVDRKEFTIFFSGTVGGYYRVDLLVRALERIKRNMLIPIRLVIAGQGDITSVMALASKLGLSHFVEYAGAIQDKERLSKMIADADVGVIPYDDNPLWKNTIPVKFFEYCACGLPVLATTREDSLLAELVKQNHIGLVCKPNDVRELAEALERLFKEKEFRENAGKQARILVEQCFDMNKIAANLFSIIRKIAGP